MDNNHYNRAKYDRIRRQRQKKRKRRKICCLIICILLIVGIIFGISRCVASKDKPSDDETTASDTQNTDTSQTDEPTDPTEESTAETTVPPEPENTNYPVLTSTSGTYSTYSGTGVMRVDNRAFEICGYIDDVATLYAQTVNKVADTLAGKVNVYSLIIPTSYGIMVPDDIKAQFSDFTDQGVTINQVYEKMTSNVIPVKVYNNLMQHRDEYLYFRTDHHWNGIGAYYAYEVFCKTKGLTPYTLEQRAEHQYEGFLGTLYKLSSNDPGLMPADTVYAYSPYSPSVSMTFYSSDGSATDWPVISDVTDWASSSKYNTFAGGDNPLTVFNNPDVTDGSVCVIVKESYGNALLPYLADHYSTVYEIDYRYWSGNIIDYVNEVGADDLIFANNMMMISTGILVGDLAKVT